MMMLLRTNERGATKDEDWVDRALLPAHQKDAGAPRYPVLGLIYFFC
jgi:hypothetical protein